MVQDVAFQVGSSTWLNYFISLEESSTPENLLLDRRVDTMKQFAPNDSDILALAKTSISVSMVSHLIPTSSSWILKVRHPFERLVSAYQNKVRWICLDKVDILGERKGKGVHPYGSDSHEFPLSYQSLPYTPVIRLHSHLFLRLLIWKRGKKFGHVFGHW